MKNIIDISNEKINLKLKKREVECIYELKNGDFEISELNITITKNCSVTINSLIKEFKGNVVININPNINCTLNIINQIEKGKIKYNYNLSENSHLNINKINDCHSIKELILVSLNGNNALINYNFKSISKSLETYNMVVNHNALRTTSDIKTNIVNILNGVSNVEVSTTIKKGYKECIANQNTKIINLTNKKCEIKPNLYIDEYDCQANHSAYVGKFNKEEMFYLMSRGLSEIEASNLLIKGLLVSDINDQDLVLIINKIINIYWR